MLFHGVASTLVAVQGTDAYNAPERSNKADMRKADVWALGCVLYELFSGGERLFQWETEQQRFSQLASMHSGWVAPQLPANVAVWQEVVDNMLAIDPAQRPLPNDVLRMGVFGCASKLARKAACVRQPHFCRLGSSCFIGGGTCPRSALRCESWIALRAMRVLDRLFGWPWLRMCVQEGVREAPGRLTNNWPCAAKLDDARHQRAAIHSYVLGDAAVHCAQQSVAARAGNGCDRMSATCSRPSHSSWTTNAVP